MAWVVVGFELFALVSSRFSWPGLVCVAHLRSAAHEWTPWARMSAARVSCWSLLSSLKERGRSTWAVERYAESVVQYGELRVSVVAALGSVRSSGHDRGQSGAR